MVDVRDAVDDPDDLSFERLRLDGAGVLQDPVAHHPRQVEPAPVALQPLDDAQRVLVVAEAEAEALAQQLVERFLARVAEGRVAEVVAETDRLDEVLVQTQRPRDHPRDRGRLERVGHSRAVVVPVGVDEDLRLPLEPPERLGVDDAIAVALEGRPDTAFLLGHGPTARLEGANGVWGETLLVVARAVAG